jgi:CDP-glucose 4,6-dehydratase
MVAAKFWMERRVLATGLLVSWLAKALVELGANVVTIVRDLRQSSGFLQSGDYRNVSIVNGELEDFRVIERAINEHEVTCCR